MTDILQGEKYRLIQGDCLEVMKQFPDGAFDACITDPPYGIGIDGSDESIRNGIQIRKRYEWKSWDSVIPKKSIFDEINFISKIHVIFGANYFINYLEQGHKGWIIWNKCQRNLTMSDCEIIYTNTDKPTRIYDLHRAKLWAENPEHPTQKPITLMRWIIENYTKPNDLIIDPFMGSGTTGVACAQTGRRFVGIELDPDYFKIAEKRIANAYAQPLLFDVPKQEEEAEQGKLL